MSAAVFAAEQTVAAFALHAAWQLPLLAGAAVIAIRAGRPGVRLAHAMWIATLALGVLLPAASTWQAQRVAARQAASNSVSVEGADYLGPLPELQRQPVWKRMWIRHAGSGTVEPFAFVLSPRLAQGITLCYLAAVAFFLYRLGRAWAGARRLRNSADFTAVPQRIHAALAQCAALMGCNAPPVALSCELAGPAVAGVLNPVLLLPAGTVHLLSSEEVRAVLAHELAHLRRHDPAANLLCSLLALPLSFHPVAHWAGRRIRQTREMACDAEAASRTGTRESYAHALLQVARHFQQHRGDTASLGLLGLLDTESHPRKAFRNRLPFTRNGRAIGALELFGAAGAMEERMQSILKEEQRERPGMLRLAASCSVVAIAVFAAGMLQVQPALAAQQQEKGSVTQAAVTPEAQPEQVPQPAAMKAQQQLAHARRQLAEAARTATTNEERSRIAAARHLLGAAQGEIAAASRPETSGFDLGALNASLAALKPLDMHAMQLDLQRAQEQLAALSSPDFKRQIRVDNEAMEQLKLKMNSPEWKAQIEAAARMDPARIRAIVAQAQKDQARAMEQLRSGAFQRQMDEASRAMARLEMPSMPGADQQTEGKSIKVSGGVMAGNIVTKVQPKYPPEGKEKHLQGSVVLHAIISETGLVEQLSVVSSPDDVFSASSLEAVRQWVYRPYLLNGNPVSVDTTITVNYTLGQ